MAGVPAAAFDAELLLRHVLGRDRAWLIVHRDDIIDDKSRELFEDAVRRRAMREPLQYITGRQEFWGLDFLVTPDVLIPRPETELVVQTALERIKQSISPLVVDLCTGSGCIAISIAKEHKGSRIIAIDVSARALEVARENSHRHSVSERIQFMEGDLFGPIAELSIRGMVDVIAANPPYIPAREIHALQPEVRDFEPAVALCAGPDGTEIQMRIIKEAPDFLKKDGHLVMEIGRGQGPALMKAVKETRRFHNPMLLNDLAGIERVIVAKKES